MCDIEENRGTKAKPTKSLSVCHWKVNSIPSHNFQKLAILMSFVAMHVFFTRKHQFFQIQV